MDFTNKLGKIKSVLCKNFLTFGEIEFEPNLYLNVVVQPDGAAKSALVSAIVVGLGGNAELLGQDARMVDYIKNGAEEATIRLVIFTDDAGDVRMFEHTFQRNGASHFQVDCNTVPLQKYLDILRTSDVRIDKVCEFMAPDRVQDFDGMSPQERLQVTLSSACGQDMVQASRKLNQLRQELRNMKWRNEMLENERAEKYTKLQSSANLLKKYEKYKECKIKLQVCNTKILWMELDQEKRAVRAVGFSEEQLPNLQRRELEEIAAPKAAINDLKREIQEKHTVCDRLRESVAVAAANTADLTESQINDGKSSESKNRRTELWLETPSIDSAASTGKMGEQLKTNSMAAESSADQLKTKMSANQDRMKTLRTDIKLFDDCRLALLHNHSSETHRANYWISENQHRFAGRVYRPVMLEVSVLDRQHAKYFENIIETKHLMAIVCENKLDFEMLTEEFSVRQHMSIELGCESRRVPVYKPSEPIENIRKYGFTQYLIDLIVGPGAVLNYLCSLYNLHKIPIGDAIIPAHIQQFYGGDKFHTISNNIQRKHIMLHVIQRENDLRQELHELEQMDHKYKQMKLERDNTKKSNTGRAQSLLKESEQKRNLEMDKHTRAPGELDTLHKQIKSDEQGTHKENDVIAEASGSYARKLKRFTDVVADYVPMEELALSLTSNVRPTESAYPHADMYALLPNDVNSLKELISNLSARLAAMQVIDPTIVEEVKQLKMIMANLERRLNDNTQEQLKCAEEHAQVYTRFFWRLNKLVGGIQEHFSQLMKSLNITGTVSFYESLDEGFGILVTVQNNTNNTDLARSMLSFIYTLSMQMTTYMPIRCVAARNQRFDDADNEQQMFEMLVRKTTEDKRGQFFFVTPKNPENVSNNDRVSVYTV